MNRLDEMLQARKAPGLAGISSGPGSAEYEMVFDRPDTAKEMRITAQRMEACGAFDGKPEMRREMEIQIKDAERKKRAGQQAKLDYQKGDHPFDRS